MVTLKWSLVFDKMTSLLQGCAVTMEISVLTLIFGTILGVMLALMRDSHIKVVSRLAQLYIWIWRGTPLMVQAFLIYFGLPNLGITFSAMTAGVLSMSLNTGAYIAEIVRSGIHAIDPGQREAAKALMALTVVMAAHMEVVKVPTEVAKMHTVIVKVLMEVLPGLMSKVRIPMEARMVLIIIPELMLPRQQKTDRSAGKNAAKKKRGKRVKEDLAKNWVPA